MKAIEIIVIVLAVLFVVGVCVFSIVRKRQGKNSCGCDCSRCGGSCSRANVKNKKKGE